MRAVLKLTIIAPWRQPAEQVVNKEDAISHKILEVP
jgi:hypothetical protein